jgi:hypothetical protein
MPLPFSLPLGKHELSQPVVNWSATFVPLAHPPAVKLTASIASGPNSPLFPDPDTAATTLVVQMDARVAIVLYEKLGNLGRSMDWPLPPEDGRQA